MSMASHTEEHARGNEGHNHVAGVWDDEMAEWYAENWGNHLSNFLDWFGLPPIRDQTETEKR